MLPFIGDLAELGSLGAFVAFIAVLALLVVGQRTARVAAVWSDRQDVGGAI